jgi:hypothetical protein
MEAPRIVLAGAWISLMLIYLLGDVLRIVAGHYEPGAIDGQPAAEWIWTLAALIMLVPIAMILATLLVPMPPNRWITVVASVALVLFNLAGLPYQGFYDNLLIGASFVVNAGIVWHAWLWP